MSGSDWFKRYSTVLIGITLAATLLVGAAYIINYGLNRQIEYHRDANQHRKEYTSNAYSPERQRCFRLAAGLQHDCVTKAKKEYDEYNREQQDLVAQRVTALWTKLMGGAAIIGMILSAFGVFLVWTTFNAAKDGNRITEETGRDQSRAYVFVNAADLYFMDETEPRLNVMLHVKNSGQTPAKWFNVRSAVDICDLRTPPDAPPHEGATWSAIGGGDTLTVQAGSDSTTSGFKFGGVDSISCRGQVEYETFFGEVFVSEFAFIAHPPFAMKFEKVEIPRDASVYVRLTSRGKEIPSKMSRAVGSLNVFQKKT